MNRRSLLKNISMLSAATLIPRTILPESIFNDSCAHNPNPKTGPCIVFSGLWAFWVRDTGVTAFTPNLQDHKIHARVWQSGKPKDLNGKKYSIAIAGASKVKKSSNPKLVAAELIEEALKGKLSIVLPANNPYPNDGSGRKFNIKAQADCVTIDMPLPKSIKPLLYVTIDQQRPLFVGGDKYLLGGTDNVLLKGFPNVQAFVYSGDSASLNQDAQADPILAGAHMQNLHLWTAPPPGGGEQHEREAFAALTRLFEKKQSGVSNAQGVQTLDLSVGPTELGNQVIVCGHLPPGVESSELPLFSEKHDPETNCAFGSGLILGNI